VEQSKTEEVMMGEELMEEVMMEQVFNANEMVQWIENSN